MPHRTPLTRREALMVIKTMREGGIDDALIRESMLQIGYDFPDGSVATAQPRSTRGTSPTWASSRAQSCG